MANHLPMRPRASKASERMGGTRLRKMVQDLVNAAGGELEAFYFAFGNQDAYTADGWGNR
jgi:hypothetical protein